MLSNDSRHAKTPTVSTLPLNPTGVKHTSPAGGDATVLSYTIQYEKNKRSRRYWRDKKSQLRCVGKVNRTAASLVPFVSLSLATSPYDRPPTSFETPAINNMTRGASCKTKPIWLGILSLRQGLISRLFHRTCFQALRQEILWAVINPACFFVI